MKYWKESTAEENEVYLHSGMRSTVLAQATLQFSALGVNALDRPIKIRDTFACYLVSCGMPPSVLNTTVDQTVEVTLPDTLSTRSTWLAQEAWKVDVVFLHEPGAGAA